MSLRPNLPRRESYKWKTYPGDVLPLSVADMDFSPPAFLSEDLHRWVEEGDFGYTVTPPDFRKGVRDWIFRRHHFEIEEGAVVPLSGVVAGISAALQCFGKPGSSYLTLTPVYPLFFAVGECAGMECIQVPLERQGSRYEINFLEIEKAIRQDTRIFLLSSPHNPTGRNFSKEELLELYQICERHDLLVVSDEIWSDWILGNERFTPFAAAHPKAAERTITFSAPSKTFNVPGLTAAYALIPDAKLRQRFSAHVRTLLPGANFLGLRATMSLYERGEPWLLEAKKMVRENIQTVKNFFGEKLPGSILTDPEATYLLWIDLTKDGDLQSRFGDKPFDSILEKAKVAFSEGKLFGKGGEGLVRMNVGTTKENLETALQRIASIKKR